ncbi:phosphopyruvate hydratase [Candidatus Micrarchaeota archaeon]|nr:phosphopyruvate hydratase [Candidatus Micrarchaeota archaeon]
MKIEKVFAREVLDSRGNPTVEAEIKTISSFARAIAPSGASTGKHEACELRDGGKRFLGKGVLKAVENVNKIIAPALLGANVLEQMRLDERMIELDGTENKSKLGANAMVAVSMAIMKAAAYGKKQQVYQHLKGKLLPMPMLNIVNGGMHAGNALAIQEFMIIPKKAKSFPEALRMSCEVYHTLGKRLVKKYGASAKNVGDEGGFAPNFSLCTDALEEITLAVDAAGYSKEVGLAVDAAASSFFDEDIAKYKIDGKELESGQLLDYYSNLADTYPILSIEDPFEEEDFESFAQITKAIGNKIQIVGDDLLVTNPKRLKHAIEKKAVNALLLKINQIGTVTESMEVASLCKKSGIRVVVSHRSGETEDSFIADFVVGIEAGQIKTGAPARGERTCKYNQLLRISEDPNSSFAKVF